MIIQKKERIVLQIKQYQLNKELSQNKLATEIGISPAQLSNVMNEDKWHKVSDEKWQSLANRFLPNDWQILPTSNLTAVKRICEDAQYYSESFFLLEHTGSGKTEGLRQYAKDTPNAYLITCNQLMSRKDLLRAILQTLGITTSGRIIDLMEIVIEHLSRMEKPLLLFDETDKLTDGCLLVLKVIYDRLEFKCGFVNAGTEALEIRVRKNALKDKIGWQELKRRFFQNVKRLKKFNIKDPVIANEIQAICEANSITMPSQIETVKNKASNFGDVRTLCRNFIRLNRRQRA